jgi:hypothetical protein
MRLICDSPLLYVCDSPLLYVLSAIIPSCMPFQHFCACRVSCVLGIGSGASSALVKGIASAGNGTVEMVVDGERMHGKVMAQVGGLRYNHMSIIE